MTSIKRPPVMLVPLVQALVLMMTTIALVYLDALDWKSYAVGGLVAVVPHMYFSMYAFRYMGARSAKLITQSFYQGEVGKYLLTLLGFAVSYLWVEDLDVKALFIGYLLMLVVQWWQTAKTMNQY